MPQEVCVTAFTLAELRALAKADGRQYSAAYNKAHAQIIEVAWDSHDSTELTAHFNERLTQEGIVLTPQKERVDIQWSLSNCQGDGVAFYGQIADVPALIKALTKQGSLDRSEAAKLRSLHKKYGVVVTIGRNSFGHHYSHHNTMTVEADCEPHDQGTPALLTKLTLATLEHVRSVSRKLEREGYQIIEEATATERLENIDEFNVLFTRRGDIIAMEW